jgi:hypothetical protein
VGRVVRPWIHQQQPLPPEQVCVGARARERPRIGGGDADNVLAERHGFAVTRVELAHCVVSRGCGAPSLSGPVPLLSRKSILRFSGADTMLQLIDVERFFLDQVFDLIENRSGASRALRTQTRCSNLLMSRGFFSIRCST